MNIPLSPRLLACCDLVAPGSRIADIGCDHGYLSIWLLTHGVAHSAIAADINEQPLQTAVGNAEKYGVRDKMECYLSDGVAAIPRDFDTLICAGVGADTMVSILEAAPWLQNGSYKLILQCQSKTSMLRRYLSESGWRIARESVLRDGRFLYTVMALDREPAQPLTPGQWHFSPALLEKPTKETTEYYRRTLGKLRLAVAGRADPMDIAALAELETLADNYTFLKEETP